MRHTSKRTLVAAVLLLLFFAPWRVVFGQSNGHFEWAKGFGTSQTNNSLGCLVKGSVTDSLGNLYILGQFRNDSEWGTGWEAERLLPMTPYGPGTNNINTIIAKISPDGEMVWKKVIHSNNGQHQLSQDIIKVGDTAFACLVELILPTEDNYTYYLDTLVRERSDYPISSMYVANSSRTAFILFDFNGNVIEQHFLHITYTDINDEDIVRYFNPDTMPWYKGDRFYRASFNIDNDGNIYICRVAYDCINDTITTENGNIRGIKIWVDNHIAGQITIDNRPKLWYPQLIKFSPHFDTILGCSYLVQKSNDNVNYDTYDTRTCIGNNGDVYIRIMQDIAGYHNNTIVIDSLRNIAASHSNLHGDFSFLVKMSNSLIPQYCIYIKDSILGDVSSSSMVRTLLHEIAFDIDSNIVFLSGYLQSNVSSMPYLRGVSLKLEKDDAFVLAIDATTGEYKSCAIVPSIQSSRLGDIESRNNLFVQKNRIFLQSIYNGGIRFPNNLINIGNYNSGIALSIFDYAGNIINGIDYNAISPNNRPGAICLHDSILYLSNRLFSDASFDYINVPIQGLYSCITKYSDTSFMTPYTGDTGDVNISIVPDAGVFTAYPNPFRQRVNIKIENTVLKAVNGTVTAILTDITGRSEEVQLSVEGDGRYVLDLTARPQASYLLTLITDDGRQHTVHLLKQSDRFGTN